MLDPVQTAATRLAGTLPLPRLMRQCIDPACGVNIDAIECRTMRHAVTRAVAVLSPPLASPAAQARARCAPAPSSWVTRLASKNRAAAAFTQARAGGPWPRLREVPMPASVAVERVVCNAAERPADASRESLLLAGWEHVRREAAARAARTPWVGRCARAAVVAGASLGVASVLTGLLPLLGVGVLIGALGAVVALFEALRGRASRRRPPAALPCDAQHLGSRHSILRALGAALREHGALLACGTPTLGQFDALYRALDALSAVRTQHLAQECAALSLPRQDVAATADRTDMARYLIDWLDVEQGICARPKTPAASLTRSAILRRVWVFLQGRDALDECLAALPTAPTLGWKTDRDHGATRVHLAMWQDALRRDDPAALRQLEALCTHAQKFVLQTYPQRLAAQIDALQEHWVSREQLHRASKLGAQ